VRGRAARNERRRRAVHSQLEDRWARVRTLRAPGKSSEPEIPWGLCRLILRYLRRDALFHRGPTVSVDGEAQALWGTNRGEDRGTFRKEEHGVLEGVALYIARGLTWQSGMSGYRRLEILLQGVWRNVSEERAEREWYWLLWDRRQRRCWVSSR
jgi:hypothetical protein